MMASAADGTVLIRVMPALSGSSCSDRILFTIQLVPPHDSGAKNSNTDRSKHIEVAASTHSSCAGLNTSWAHDRKAEVLLWAIITPLGLPVEPEV